VLQINLIIKSGMEVVKVKQLTIETEEDVQHKRHMGTLTPAEQELYDSLPKGLPEIHNIEVTI
jgi:hypothetical protein